MSMAPAPEHYWQTPHVNWVKDVPAGWNLLVLHVRNSRRRAKVVAVVEALRVLRDLGAVALIGGPGAEVQGVFWLALPPATTNTAIGRLRWLGYTNEVDQCQQVPEGFAPLDEGAELARWRGLPYVIRRIYTEDPNQILGDSPDRRLFQLEKSGQVVEIRGYRGDGQDMSRRGLPVADARLLANLVLDPTPRRFLDPFAGAGGVVMEAVRRGFTVYSVDIDPILRPGLEAMGAHHKVADASNLPFPGSSFEAIATEPPYHPDSKQSLIDALGEMDRVLAHGGHLAILCAGWQADLLRKGALDLGLRCFLDSEIDRKGLAVTILAWDKILAETHDLQR